MSCEPQEPTETVMENNLLEIEDPQRGEKKQKIFDPNHTMQEEADLPAILSATLPSTSVDNLNSMRAISASNPLVQEVPDLQLVEFQPDPTLSFQIPFHTWTNFILQFKALEHKVEDLTHQIAVLTRGPVAPADRKPPQTKTDLSGNVVQSPPDRATQTFSTHPLANHDVNPPPPAEDFKHAVVAVDLWQKQLSKRDKKAATKVVPAPAADVQSFPFLRAVTGGKSAVQCTQQSSCSCSRCLGPQPLPPPKVLQKEMPSPQPQPRHQRNSAGGETSSKNKQPLRSFREKIASIASSNELLDRLLAREQDPLPRQHTPESRAVSSIYFSCRLTRQGRRDPLFSLRKIFQGFTEVHPLECNLVSHSPTRSVAEIFLPEIYKEQALRLLPESSIVWGKDLSYKDVRRRAASYNRSFFLELRRANLDGLSNQLQLEVLATAEAAIPRLPEGRRKGVQMAIHSDREWVLAQ